MVKPITGYDVSCLGCLGNFNELNCSTYLAPNPLDSGEEFNLDTFLQLSNSVNIDEVENFESLLEELLLR